MVSKSVERTAQVVRMKKAAIYVSVKRASGLISPAMDLLVKVTSFLYPNFIYLSFSTENSLKIKIYLALLVRIQL